MRAERLYSVALNILADLDDQQIEKYFDALVVTLEEQISNASEESQTAIASARETLATALKASRFNSYPPNQYKTLEEMGVEFVLGNEFLVHIDEAFEGNQVTPIVALEQLNQRRKWLSALRSRSEDLISGLKYYEVKPDTLNSGEFELTISIPSEAVDHELEQFGRETIRLDRLVGVFSEIATGSREHIKIRAIASSDLTLFLDSAPAIAVLLATSIERVAALYEKVLGIIKIHREMKVQEVPVSVLEPLKKHIDVSLKNGIDAIAKQIEKENFKNVDQSRRQELKTELIKSLGDLANRLDRGYGFDVRGEGVKEELEEGQEVSASTKAINKAAQIVAEARPKLQHFISEDEPILGLPEPGFDEAGVASSG